MYTVVSSYYKHAEVDLVIIPKNKMRQFCIEQLVDYFDSIHPSSNDKNYKEMKKFTKHVTAESQSKNPKKLPNYNKYTLDYLIQKVVELGNQIVEQQSGWGVRYIVSGENMVIVGTNKNDVENKNNDDKSDDKSDDESDDENDDASDDN